ncbi:probable G-protein coupled receptor 179 [Apteryx mantelli]|uniref:Probable G-protein coupled receptor 179 n=1 Tax=Apteryx mantelli TaxID=2696672 RepID=A0ABM4FSH1_9AVES
MGLWLWPLLCCLHVALLRGGGGSSPRPRPLAPKARSPPGREWLPASPEPQAPTPEPDPEGSAAALAFLRSGDATRLARANCSRRFAVGTGGSGGGGGGGPPASLRAALRAAAESLAHAANFLNMLLQASDIREASLAEDAEWYHALVRSLVAGDPRVYRAVLAFDAHPLASKPRLMLQATQESPEILLQDLSAAATSGTGRGNLSGDDRWFDTLESQRLLSLRKRLLRNDLRSLETPKWSRGDGYVGDAGQVRWSPPFLECRDGKFLPAWMVTLSSSFYGLKPDLSPEFKGIVRLDVKLQDVQLDPCASGPGWFADTHRCDLNSTQCVPQESRGFVLGSYVCRCKPGFYGAGGAASGAGAGGSPGSPRLACRPCRPGCATCADDAPCLVEEHRALRAAVLSCQAACMLAVFLSMLVSYHFRKSKRIRASGVILLETILFGSLLLYFPVFILYFKPSIFRCIVLRWVRMLGFAIVYGTITLKLYRVLKVFLSRTAQRVPYMSSGRVLKMLGLILLLVLWFLVAWTIGMLENVDRNVPLVIRSQTARGLQFYLCGHDRWDYMMVIAEMLFLLWGSSLCLATRSVPSAFHEPRYLGIALHNELLVSAAFHLARFVLVPSLHPDWTLLLFFAHTHGTITATLALLFIPKFLHAGSPLREEIAAEVYEDELDMRRSGSYLNSSIASAWSEHSLDPDDIRDELKKLYAQLEAHKTRRMAASNPHLPKKRSSRRGLGRSILRRIAELPEAAARRGGRHEGDGASPPARGRPGKRRLAEAGSGSLRLREGSWRRRAVSLRKSRSTEEQHARLPVPPASPARKTAAAAAKAPEPSDSESLEAAPLVCKSASAHDLTADKQLLRPVAPPLQKSLSFVAGSRDEALLLATREKLSEPAWDERPGAPRGRGAPGKPHGTEVPAGSGGAAAGSPCRDRARRHVTYAPVKSASADGAQRPGRVRVAVRRTRPAPPARHQSLAPGGDGWGGAVPPADPPAPAAPAELRPWEPRREETSSGEQRAAGAAGLGTPGGASTPGLGTPAQRASIRSLGFSLQGFGRSRGRRSWKGEKEGEGGGGDGGSGGERPPGGPGHDATVGGKQATISLREGADRHDSSAGTAARSVASAGSSPAWERTGDARRNVVGEPSSAQDSTGGAPRTAEGESPRPCAVPASVCSRKAAEQPCGATGPDPCDASAPKVEAAEVRPREALGAPPGKGPLLRQEAIAAWEDGGVPPGGTSPAELHEPVCPRESPDPWGIPARSRSPRKPAGKAERTASWKAELRPWEAEADSSVKVEICPGEESRGLPETGKPGRDWDQASGGEALQTPRPRDAGEKVPPKPAGVTWRETVCPWESLDVEGARAKHSASADPLGATASKAGSGESAKAEICPWEAGEVEPERERLEQERTRLSKWAKIIWPKSVGLLRAQQSGSSHPAAARPWASAGVEAAAPKAAPKSPELPQATARSPEGTGSAKALACPWDKAEICPWEASAALSDAAKLQGDESEASRAKKGVSARGAGPRGASDPPEAVQKGSLPQTPPRRAAGGAGSGKADVCPWEAEEEPPPAEAETCPRGAPATPADREKPRQGASEGENLPGSRGVEATKAKLAEKGGGRPESSACPREGAGAEVALAKLVKRSLERLKAERRERQGAKAEVCPWEAEEPDTSRKAEICPWEASEALPEKEGKKGKEKEKEPAHKRITHPAALAGPAKSPEKGSSEREAVCPWESPDTEDPAAKPHARSPGWPKSPSRTSRSVESRKAEVCPWETQEREGGSKAEICPWDVAAPPSAGETLRAAEDGLSAGSKSPSPNQSLLKEAGGSAARKKEKASRERESVCPWESPDTEEPAVKPHAGSPGLPKAPSRKPEGTDSRRADVCPWEAAGAEAGVGSDICPWEGTGVPPDEPGRVIPSGTRAAGSGHPAGTFAQAEFGSSQRESVCPWESPGAEEPSLKSGMGNSPSKKSESTESRKSDICPWEAAEPEAVQKESVKPEVHPRGAARAPPAEAGKPAAGAGAASPTAPLGNPAGRAAGKAEHKPLCRVLPGVQPPRDPGQGGGAGAAPFPQPASSSRDTAVADVCPWEAEGALPVPVKPIPETSKPSAVCPWEAESAEPTPTLRGQGRAGESRGDGGGGATRTSPDVCPWDHE